MQRSIVDDGISGWYPATQSYWDYVAIIIKIAVKCKTLFHCRHWSRRKKLRRYCNRKWLWSWRWKDAVPWSAIKCGVNSQHYTSNRRCNDGSWLSSVTQPMFNTLNFLLPGWDVNPLLLGGSIRECFVPGKLFSLKVSESFCWNNWKPKGQASGTF